MAGLFRRLNRYIGNLQPMPRVFPDYPALAIHAEAMGHASVAHDRRAATMMRAISRARLQASRLSPHL